jgi:hypothetical protein
MYSFKVWPQTSSTDIHERLACVMPDRLQICTLAEYGIGRWINIWNLQDTLAFVLQVQLHTTYTSKTV